MENKDFLIEIGMEEIPSRFIQNAIAFMKDSYEKELTQFNLSFSAIKAYSTPRRFALSISNLAEKQEDTIKEKIGPTLEIAYKNKQLTKAGQGFLRGCGSSEKDIFIKDTEKGQKISVRIEKKGKLTTELLLSITNHVLTSFSFPKSMRWNHKKIFFARPIRWLLLLWDNQPLPFNWNGIEADAITYGNRICGLNKPIHIDTISHYETKLQKYYVFPHREKRKHHIKSMLTNFYKNSAWEIVKDDALINTVTDIVEYPSVVEGNFAERFLTLPEKVIINTLTEHQKYFAVRCPKQNKLANRFLFIANGHEDYKKIIRKGNEKVIKARLSDAEFYFQEDTKQSLESFVPKLEEVLFEAKLGTLLEKTQRIVKLVEFIFSQLPSDKVSADDKKLALRAAYLAKADLVSQMLGEKEFTKLQGYIGMIYAEISGEPKEVCQAIFEHYLPRGKEDDLPASLPGAIVAIADKLDTVCGIIGSGRLPTGSNDPFAIRRAASGIVQIIHFHDLPLEIDKLVQFSFSLYNDKFKKNQDYYDFVVSYFKQRIIWYLQQEKIEQDVIKSVMHIDFYNVVDAIVRAKDLQSYKQRDDFQKLVTGFKRVSNIIEKQKTVPEMQQELLIEPAEIELYRELQILSAKVSEYLQQKQYHEVMEKLVSFSNHIDTFFDDVLVNTENDSLRLNRYRLLSTIRSIFLKVADLAQINIENKE